MSCVTDSSQCCITHRRGGCGTPTAGNRRKGGWFLPETQGSRWCWKAWLSLGPAVEYRPKTQIILLAASQEVRFAKSEETQNNTHAKKNPQTSNPDAKLKHSGQFILAIFHFTYSLAPMFCLVLKEAFHSTVRCFYMYIHHGLIYPDLS